MGFDLGPTGEQLALRETLHSLTVDLIRREARAAESARRTGDDIALQIHGIGVTAPVAEEYGGGGTFDAVTYCIAAEELAWGNPGIAWSTLGSGMAAIVIGLAGTDEQKRRYLPRFCADDPVPTFVAIGEKVAAGDLAALDTKVSSGTVSGEKYGVLNAEDAPFGVVVGRGPNGLAAAVVEGGTYEVLAPEDKMGLEAAPTSIVRFDGPGDELPPGPDLERAILWAKLATGAVAVGCARASLEYASEYATEREAFGKPIGAFQAVSFKVADMAIIVEAARTALWRAAWNLDRGQATASGIAEATGQALSAAIQCGDDGVQVLGGHGYIQDHPVEMWFRDAVTLSVFDAPDVLGDLTVARSMVG
ncbi:MAG TPA: acyl-CoA dehydrogenase family protein [Actinomycetota bacterium]|nr:acyl-CoA dehydrogenase family protein [Actinomycetota bacterium]